jgi:hypothetical protein
MQVQESQIVKLQDEQMLLEDLMDDTFQLIKRATNLNPVKKLIEIHDILSLNASLLHRFRSSELTFDEVWLDTATLKHLNNLRCTLMVFHHTDFISVKELQIYNRAFCRFLNLVILRLKNGFDVSITKINC